MMFFFYLQTLSENSGMVNSKPNYFYFQTMIQSLYNLSLVVRKPVFGASDQVPHKPVCTATEDDQRLEISDLGYREADLRLCFRTCKRPVFLQ